MAGKKGLTGQITTEYLEKYPNVPSLTLARMILRDHPLVYNSVEHARISIRSFRGAAGDRTRGKVKDRRFYGTGGMALPEGEEEQYKPYEMPKVNNNILFMSDIHLPFHDKASIQLALEDAADKDVNTVVLGGDILDMYSLSSFQKIPSKSTFVHERDLFWWLMDDINHFLPKAKVFWIEGNHEYRFSRYMLNKAVEVYDVPEFSIPVLFDLHTLGVEYINRKQYIRAGSLNIMHGHEFGTTSQGVNPARGMFLKAKDNTLFGHLHKSSEHVTADVRGRIISTYSVGCLCYLHPEYRPLNEWNSGFALIEIHPDGSYMAKNKKIENGRIR